jgi:phosphoenolpyruvate synthase/pyruvate phosphate dikinase
MVHAIEEIHKQSFQKTGEKIPVVIQEMVDAEVAGVALSYDVDENKAYTVIQMGNGNGESLVSGEQTGETYKIHRYIDAETIPDVRLRALYLAVRFLSQKYFTRYIDIEFAFTT